MGRWSGNRASCCFDDNNQTGPIRQELIGPCHHSVPHSFPRNRGVPEQPEFAVPGLKRDFGIPRAHECAVPGAFEGRNRRPHERQRRLARQAS